MNLVKEIENSFEVLVRAESEDTGKPEWLTRSVDIPRCSENIRFFATASCILIQNYTKWMEVQ